MAVMSSSPLRYCLTILALTLVYYVSGQVGLFLSAESSVASVVWPPAGLSLAVLLTRGQALIPGLFLGALFVDLSVGLSWPAAACMALGSTLEAALACYWLRRSGWHDHLDRLQDVFRLGVAALGTAWLSAGISVLALAWANVPFNPGRMFLVWWLGDAMGALILVPALRIWSRRPWPSWPREQPRQLELVALAGGALAVNAIIFLSRALPVSFRHRSSISFSRCCFGPPYAMANGALPASPCSPPPSPSWAHRPTWARLWATSRARVCCRCRSS